RQMSEPSLSRTAQYRVFPYRSMRMASDLPSLYHQDGQGRGDLPYPLCATCHDTIDRWRVCASTRPGHCAHTATVVYRRLVTKLKEPKMGLMRRRALSLTLYSLPLYSAFSSHVPLAWVQRRS